MAMPQITDAELVGLANGSRRVVDSSLVRRLYERTLWLARVKPVIHWAWGDGVDCATLGDTASPFAYTAGSEPGRVTWELGTTTIPGVGNETGTVRLYAMLADYSSGTLRAGLRVRPLQGLSGEGVLGAQWIDLGASALATADGWSSVTFTVPQAIADGPMHVQVYVTTWNGTANTSAQANMYAWSLWADGTAWPRNDETLGPHMRRTSGPPDDVWTLRRLKDWQEDTAAIPRVLAHHSFHSQQPASGNQPAWYVIPAPMTNGTLTVYAYCRTTVGAAAHLRVACDTTDPAAVIPAADNSTAFTSSTLAWRTVTVTPTPGSTNYLTVWVDPDTGDTADLRAVYVVQAEHDTGNFEKGTAAWRILPVSERDTEPGALIVNTWSGGLGGEAPDADETVQNLWTDRFASLNNSVWWVRSRGHTVLPGDWCQPTQTSTAAYGSGLSVETRVQPAFGATRLRVFSAVTTVGVPVESDERLALVAADAATGPVGSGMPRATLAEGPPAAVAWGTTATLSMDAGYTDRNGDPASGTASFRFVGAAAWEVAPVEPANLVHFRGYSDNGIAIPDNDAVTGASDTIVCSRAFPVGMVRAHVVLDHAAPASVKLTLSDGTTTVILADFGDLSADGTLSFSDAWPDDTVPAEALSVFRGDTSAATWTLTAYDNAAGTTGSVPAWALELW